MSADAPSVVRFSFFDACFFWYGSATGYDLAAFIGSYTFGDRAALPEYQVVAACLDGAARVGVMLPPTDGTYRVSPGWYVWLHRRDGEFSAPEDGMVEVAEELAARDWPALTPGFTLARGDYDRAAAVVNARLEALFGPRK